MKYKITNKRRAAAFLTALLIYAGISIAASLWVDSWITGLFVQLSLAAINAVATLFLIFKPLERIDNEKTQTVSHCGDGNPDCCHP